MQGKPKVACPMHKKTFSLQTGQCLTGEDYTVQVFPVKVEGDDVLLYLPPVEVLDEALATNKTCNHACPDDNVGVPAEKKGRRKGTDPFAVHAAELRGRVRRRTFATIPTGRSGGQ